MEETIIQILARELERPEQHVRNIIALLDEGNTVPFIARYRKELHGGMDDQLTGSWPNGCSTCAICSSAGTR